MYMYICIRVHGLGRPSRLTSASARPPLVGTPEKQAIRKYMHHHHQQMFTVSNQSNVYCVLHDWCILRGTDF